MLLFLQSHPVFALLCAALAAFLGRFIAKAYAIRSHSRKLPGPPHSWLFGHAMAMGDIAATLPRNVHPHVYPQSLREKYNLGSFFYIDAWPFSDPLLAVLDPDICQQVALNSNIKKHPTIGRYIYHLVGEDDMVSADGLAWKKWRTIFNPGFATQHLMTLVPGIVEDTEIYVSNLEKHVISQDVFSLEEVTTRLTIDIIGKVVLDLSFNMQNGENECISAFREQVHLLPNGTHPLEMWSPIGIYRRWKNTRTMTSYIGKVLDNRFAKHLAESASTEGKNPRNKSRTVLDLALSSYLSGSASSEDFSSGATQPPPIMDSAFKAGLTTQIRVLLFAGHDTTSSTICYAVHLLAKHPACLQRIRSEHDLVFGSELASTAEQIKSNPHILNKLEYTLAVLKETLRLFPAASAPRAGAPDIFLKDPKTGEMLPTEGYIIWLVHHGVHYNEDVWGGTAKLFDPERFMPGKNEVAEGAFRPFETGSRNCLGQNLAMLEGRVVLALICRRFDFELALKEASGDRKGKQEVNGEELYQILIGAAKPRDGMPVRVKRAEDNPEM